MTTSRLDLNRVVLLKNLSSYMLKRMWKGLAGARLKRESHVAQSASTRQSASMRQSASTRQSASKDSSWVSNRVLARYTSQWEFQIIIIVYNLSIIWTLYPFLFVLIKFQFFDWSHLYHKNNTDWRKYLICIKSATDDEQQSLKLFLLYNQIIQIKTAFCNI